MANTTMEQPARAETASPASEGPSEAAPRQGARHEHRWWVLAVLALSQLMVVLDATIVNIALPSAQTSLDFSNNDRQWVITAYSLGSAMFTMVASKIGRAHV